MNKTFKIVRTLGILLLVIFVVVAGVLGIKITLSELEALDSRIPTTREYSDYVIVDRNLIWTDTGEILGQYKRGLNQFTYQEIKGIDKRKHIGALMSTKDPIALFTSTSAHVVLTSPDQDRNIWENWMVDRIELFYFEPYISNEVDPPDYTRYSISESSDVSVLKNFINIINVSEKVSTLPSLNMYFEHPIPGYECGIRIYFKKFDSIVWQARIDVVSDGEYIDSILEYGDNKRLFITVFSLDGKEEWIEIPEGSELYRIIREALYD